MRLPARLLTSEALLLGLVDGSPDVLGQSTGSVWVPQGLPMPCAVFPAGERITRQAQLVGVSVAREVYLPAVNLDPQRQRLRIGADVHEITLVNEWDGFTVAGVTMPSPAETVVPDAGSY